MPRIFVRDFPKSTVKLDIEVLFNKLCPVEDVYIPLPTVTGINRNFAIVTLNCSDDIAAKCIKAFHNSNWNGARIRVELANVWYKNRFADERSKENTVIIPEQTVVEKPVPVVHNNVITLKRSYLLPVLKVSLKPRKSVDSVSKRKSVVPCGVRTILDDSSFTSNDELSSESESEDEVVVLAPVVAVPVVTAKTTASVASAVTPVAAVSHLQGGGSRKGFGTLLQSAPSKVSTLAKAPVAKVTKKHSTDDTQVERFDEYSNGGLDVDFGISDGEFDDDSDEDGERCVGPEELEEATLLRERQRAIALMQSVLGGGGIPDPAPVNNESSETENSGDLVSNPIKPDVPDSSAAGSGAMVSRNGWNSVVMMRFNPGKAAPKKTQEAAGMGGEPPKSVVMEVQNGAGVTDSAVSATSAAAADGPDSNINSSSSKGAEVVQLDKLKSIFYKEGGVWWDDSGSVATGEAVMRGVVDPLFLEAEKFGIDIRTTAQTTESGSADSGMLFGFFEEEPQQAPLVAAEALNGDTHMVVSDKQVDVDSGRVSAEESIVALSGAKRESVMSKEEMVAIAKKFCRISSLDEINKDWAENRDKLVLDYKRKFKDARKRNNGVVLTETVPATTVRVNKTAHAKSKSRGGVKHSRKKS